MKFCRQGTSWRMPQLRSQQQRLIPSLTSHESSWRKRRCKRYPVSGCMLTWTGPMTNRHKQKGTRWESAVRDFLSANSTNRVERMPAGAALDRGDLSGVPGVCIECKDVQKIELAAIVDEAVAEAINCRDDSLPVAVIKRRRKGVEDGYAVMPLWAWTQLQQQAQHKEP
jgi:hypothetical protein